MEQKEKTLVELVLKDGKYHKKGNGGEEVPTRQLTSPIGLRLNGATREAGRTYEQNVERLISQASPAEANAYMRGAHCGNYLPVVYYTI